MPKRKHLATVQRLSKLGCQDDLRNVVFRDKVKLPKKVIAGGGRFAWHDGDMKVYCKNVKSGKWELYDLAADPREKTNLATSHPEKLKGMIAAWTKWKAAVDASDQGGDYSLE